MAERRSRAADVLGVPVTLVDAAVAYHADYTDAIDELLDEMHAPSVAVELTRQTFDVVALAAQPDLRGMADEEPLAHAAGMCVMA